MMTKTEADQVARIIEDIFQYEEQIDPRTVALVFKYLGRMNSLEQLLYETSI